MNSVQLESAKKLFFILLGVDIAISAVVGLNGFSTVGTLNDIQLGKREVDQSLLSSLEFWEKFSGLAVLTTIGVGLGLVKWLNSCYHFSKVSLGAAGFKNEKWTAAGWIIPGFNLFKPYQIINEIYKAGAPTYTAPDDWKKESGSGLLLTWWIFWAVTHFILWMLSKNMFRKSFRDDLTLPQIVGLYDLQAWVCVISVVIAVLWFVIANHLTQRLIARHALHSSSTVQAQVTAQPLNRQTPSVGLKPISQQSAGTTPSPAMSPELRPTAQPPQTTNHQIPTIEDTEDRIYAQVGEEIESGNTDKGIWTRAFSQAGGDDKQTRVLYIQLRVARLLAAERDQQQPSFTERQTSAEVSGAAVVKMTTETKTGEEQNHAVHAEQLAPTDIQSVALSDAERAHIEKWSATTIQKCYDTLLSIGWKVDSNHDGSFSVTGPKREKHMFMNKNELQGFVASLTFEVATANL
jgi:hypothetical protein